MVPQLAFLDFDDEDFISTIEMLAIATVGLKMVEDTRILLGYSLEYREKNNLQITTMYDGQPSCVGTVYITSVALLKLYLANNNNIYIVWHYALFEHAPILPELPFRLRATGLHGRRRFEHLPRHQPRLLRHAALVCRAQEVAVMRLESQLAVIDGDDFKFFPFLNSVRLVVLSDLPVAVGAHCGQECIVHRSERDAAIFRENGFEQLERSLHIRLLDSAVSARRHKCVVERTESE